MSITWESAADYHDIRYELGGGEAAGIAKVTINRPEVRNAFRPETVIELSDALNLAREDEAVGVIILTGEGPEAFCSGGDQRVRGERGGYVTGADAADAGQPALNSSSPTEAQQDLYSLGQSDYHVIASGTNGGYNAAPGYNLVTGLGTPVANLLVPDMVAGNYPATGQVAPISSDLNANPGWSGSGGSHFARP